MIPRDSLTDNEAFMIPRNHVPSAAALVLILLELSLLAPTSGAATKRADFGTIGSGRSASAASRDAGPRAPRDGATQVATSGTIPNLPVCTALSNQTDQFLFPSGQGGDIVVWQDTRAGNLDIYAQRVGSDQVEWSVDGVPVCKAAGAQTSPRAVSDGAGGLIAVWVDARPTGQGADIYVQRVNSDGAQVWTNDGVLVCGAITDQYSPVIVADGVGGAIVAWIDPRSSQFEVPPAADIYAQRISPSGVLQWATDGVPVYTGDPWAETPRQGLTIASDGQQGAFLVWQDGRTDVGDIYAQRINGSGVSQWTTNGVPMSAATGVQQNVAAISDGANGAIVAWEDGRGASLDIYAQRVSDAAVMAWTTDGVPLCVAAGQQRVPAVCGDGAGGAVVAWQDARPGAQGTDIYAQRVNAAGSAVWTANGVGICTATTDQVAPSISLDPMGGAFVAWSDGRTPANGTDVYAQHITTAAGAAQWTANGVQVSDAVNGQDAVGVAADGIGGAIAVWRDARSGSSFDIYAERITSDGQVADACVTQTLMTPLTFYTTTGAVSYYEAQMIDLNWNVVGVRSSANSDWDLEWFDTDRFGHEIAPICYSTQIGGSYVSGGVDLLVGDLNPTHTTAVNPGDPGFGIRAVRYSGTGKDSVQWDNGVTEVTKETTGSTCGAKPATTPWKNVVDMWEIVLFANKTYKFDLTSSGGSIKMLFFSDAGQTGTYIVPRSAAKFEMSNGIYYLHIDITEVYGVLFVNDSNQSGTYCLKVTTQTGASGVGDNGSVIATELRSVSPNPSSGPVHFDFALREPGSVGFDVIDMAGRMLAKVPARQWEAGIWSTEWDGLRSHGVDTPAGVYFVQMRVNGQRVGLKRLAIVR